MTADPRHITAGRTIPTEHYTDQPYVVRTDDDAWLCTLTTGSGEEGQPGQHVVSMRSEDCGRTWSAPVDVEPADGPEASYSVMLKVPSGRIYCFYNHNTDNLRHVVADTDNYPDGKCTRVDSLGYFVFKYSDDHGRSWSDQRYVVPVREFEIDRQNPYGGEVRFFWNVGRPFAHDGRGYVPLIKVGGFGRGFFTRNEGVLLASDNILTEADPTKIRFETLPDGDVGLCTPPGGGPIAAEHSYSVLSDGSFYVVYRSIDGHPVEAYSRDGGHTWSTPQYKRYDDGRLMKHPRAANFAWRCANGKFLYWFHNHGGRSYEDRNPAWLCGGVEADGPEGPVIRWTQPEIALYDDGPLVRMSYPDFIETDDGTRYLTETQKTVARAHPLDNDMLEMLWNQFDRCEVAGSPTLVDLSAEKAPMPESVDAPQLPAFHRHSFAVDLRMIDQRTAFTIEMAVRFDEMKPNEVLLDNRTAGGKGLAVATTADGRIELVVNDGRTESRWACDPEVLRAGADHHVVIVIDGGPKTISFIVDGLFNDGGEHRQFGFGRFSPHLVDVNGSDRLRIAPTLSGTVDLLRIYERALTTTEAIGNYRAWKK